LFRREKTENGTGAFAIENCCRKKEDVAMAIISYISELLFLRV